MFHLTKWEAHDQCKARRSSQTTDSWESPVGILASYCFRQMPSNISSSNQEGYILPGLLPLLPFKFHSVFIVKMEPPLHLSTFLLGSHCHSQKKKNITAKIASRIKNVWFDSCILQLMNACGYEKRILTVSWFKTFLKSIYYKRYFNCFEMSMFVSINTVHSKIYSSI